MKDELIESFGEGISRYERNKLDSDVKEKMATNERGIPKYDKKASISLAPYRSFSNPCYYFSLSGPSTS